jgi:hypothetical protein
VAGFLLETAGLPADVQSQLQMTFIQNGLTDLALLGANGSA